ncbi:MAG TPA: kelch repeat-containing protein [Candidatus Eisenbacteria bacterium]|nr:kelch repeat-containing protein [Candidatus Eisenbacteria bacterium]
MRYGAFRKLSVTAALCAIVAAGPARSGPIETLQPGMWYQVPSSHLSAVLPSPIPPGLSGPGAITGAWSGGAYDSKRDRLLVWGGGHADYGGNEIYAFDMNALSWSRIWGPSSSIPDPGGSATNTYSDGNPVSRHTYDGLEYLPATDQFWINGGSRYCGSGSAGRDTWVFDFASNRWVQKADLPVCDGCAYLEQATGYDPVTGHIWLVQAGNELMEYDPSTNAWTKRGGSAIGSDKAGAIDWKRRKFVVIGGGEAFFYDISQSGTVSRQTLNTTGATAIVGTRYPGIVYDPVADRIVAWNGGADIYILDMDTLVWTRQTTSGSVVPTSAASAGTYGRFRYVPSKNVYVVVNGIDEDVYIYRLSAGGTPGPTDSAAPAAITDLRPR